MKKYLKEVLREEIALEGLDGITFQALWLRVAEATSSEPPFSNSFHEYIWKLVKLMTCFQYYQLEEPRKDLVTFNRFKSSFVPDDIYPHKAINDAANNIKGSCSTYHTRVNVTEQAKMMGFEEVLNKWGSKFVIVTDQKTREEFLFGCKGQVCNMSEIKYCMLERIGRSRYNGEITYGQNSLLALGEDPKSLFYYRKSLLELNIIKKQIFTQRSENHIYNGTLLHLTRYYKADKPKYIKLCEKVISFLKTKKNNWALYEDVKSLMRFSHFKKLMRTEIYQEHIRNDVFVPYRTIFPSASPEEWQSKSSRTKEKILKLVQLKNPDKATLKYVNEAPKKYDNKLNHPTDVKTSLNLNFLTLVCRTIKSFGGKGCSELEVKKKLGLPRLIIRLVVRNLLKKKLIATFLVDDGRQRLNKYCYKEFEKDGEMAQIVNKQRKATLELLLDSSDDDDDADNEAGSSQDDSQM